MDRILLVTFLIRCASYWEFLKDILHHLHQWEIWLNANTPHWPIICDVFLSEKPTEWDEYLRTAAHSYNNTPHLGTKMTPMEVLFGFTADIPSNLKRTPQPVYNQEIYHKGLKNKLQLSFKLARENLMKSKEISKRNYDKKLIPKTFTEGRKVFMSNMYRASKLNAH